MLSQNNHLYSTGFKTASSERAMHILFNKKGRCIYYTMSICVSRLNTICSLHLVYWMIKPQTTHNLLWTYFQSKLRLTQYHHLHCNTAFTFNCRHTNWMSTLVDIHWRIGWKAINYIIIIIKLYWLKLPNT